MNTQNDKATPRPWHLTGVYDICGNGDSALKVCEMTEPTSASPNARANAALIVRAVNEYEALKSLEEAARQSRTMLDGMARTPEIRKVWAATSFDLSARESLMALESALSALAKLREGKP